MNKDPVTLAYINMYGLLGALQDLCRFSEEAGKLAGAGPGPFKPLTVGFVVKNGPAMTLSFADGACTAQIGEGPCDIKLPFGSCEKFNGLVDGTVTPIPSKGFTRIGFLTKNFVRLTGILETYLRPKPESLGDPGFFRASTTIMFFLIARALVEIGNHDRIGRFSASNIADGTVLLSIAGERSSSEDPASPENPAGSPPGAGTQAAALQAAALQAAITIKDHRLSLSRVIPEQYHAIMEFGSLTLARQLFDGQVSAIGCIGQGLISLRGNLGILDNVNRILDRVALYLA
ncbi:MAG: hypothetical protein LBQ38_09555 [Spirochaetaceae bacterium]|jgi:hypothetical protein|nr:hypothetical protein [Spirochaetaceae bacterium]